VLGLSGLGTCAYLVVVRMWARVAGTVWNLWQCVSATHCWCRAAYEAYPRRQVSKESQSGPNNAGGN
jgi:hypothetical protein